MTLGFSIAGGAKARQAAKREGYAISSGTLATAEWVILVTSLKVEAWSSVEIGELYRARGLSPHGRIAAPTLWRLTCLTAKLCLQRSSRRRCRIALQSPARDATCSNLRENGVIKQFQAYVGAYAALPGDIHRATLSSSLRTPTRSGAARQRLFGEISALSLAWIFPIGSAL